MSRPGRALRAAALLGLILVAASASDRVNIREPLPFGHREHARAFERAGVGCLDCHPVGARAEAEAALPLPEAPLSSCHGCHLGELARAPGDAPSGCLLCHADLEGLMPRDHQLDWISLHGQASRAAGQDCQSCHEPAGCLDCHDARGAGSENPHPAGFRSTHGVEARIDPRSCSTCHTETSCTSCHVKGALPW